MPTRRSPKSQSDDPNEGPIGTRVTRLEDGFRTQVTSMENLHSEVKSLANTLDNNVSAINIRLGGMESMAKTIQLDLSHNNELFTQRFIGLEKANSSLETKLDLVIERITTSSSDVSATPSGRYTVERFVRVEDQARINDARITELEKNKNQASGVLNTIMMLGGGKFLAFLMLAVVLAAAASYGLLGHIKFQ